MEKEHLEQLRPMEHQHVMAQMVELGFLELYNLQEDVVLSVGLDVAKKRF
jgi:hypothetical protein